MKKLLRALLRRVDVGLYKNQLHRANADLCAAQQQIRLLRLGYENLKDNLWNGDRWRHATLKMKEKQVMDLQAGIHQLRESLRTVKEDRAMWRAKAELLEKQLDEERAVSALRKV